MSNPGLKNEYLTALVVNLNEIAGQHLFLSTCNWNSTLSLKTSIVLPQIIELFYSSEESVDFIVSMIFYGSPSFKQGPKMPRSPCLR